MSAVIGKKSFPENPGVYVFKKNQTPVYIGKAANLKKRLSSYFRKNAGGKVGELINEATKLDWIETASEIEALIKEAKLIKKYHPKYNILMRDDKNYFYVGVTKEEFPKVFITHQPGVDLKTKYIGPFTNGNALKVVLRLLRRVFPYCTCRKPHKRPCLNSQIGRCLGFCCLKSVSQKTSDRAKNDYQKSIENITSVLNGKSRKLLLQLKRGMRGAVKNQDFEKAAKIRDQIFGIENIFAHRAVLYGNRYRGSISKIERWDKIEQTIRVVLKIPKAISRVEGYDISNISGREATGSMVVFIDGHPAKSEYRKFKIRTVFGSNDVAMLQEVIRRRLKHTEWRYPNLMLIDGGRPQLNAAIAALSNFQKPYVVALAKREEELYTEKGDIAIRLSSLPQDVAYFFQRVRDESHRFAKKYHHKLREISYRAK